MISYEKTRDIFNELLDRFGIEYTCRNHHNGYQWYFPAFPSGDIICCDGSYHADKGYVESYGFPWDDGDVSTMLPQEMILYLIGERTEHISNYGFDDLIASLCGLLE